MTWSQGGALMTAAQRRKAARDFARYRTLIAEPASLGAAEIGEDFDPFVLVANGFFAVSSTVELNAGDVQIEVGSTTYVLPALEADQILRLGFWEKDKTVTFHRVAGAESVLNLYVMDDFRRPHLVAASSDTAEDAVDDGDATASLVGSGGELTDLFCDFDNNDPDGAASNITYQWFKDDVEIPGETTDTYSLLTADIGSVFKCRVQYDDPDSTGEEIFSDEVTCVAVNNGVSTVGISGVAQSGETMTASFNDDDPDGAATVGPTYQWYREAVLLAGETNATYDMVVADEGFRVRCLISYTDGQGYAEQVYTAFSGVIQNPVVNDGPGTATLSGVHTEGFTLTCTFNDDDPDGPGTGVSYQWFRDPDGSNTSIGGATNSTYVLQAADVGFEVRCRVSYTDGQGFAEVIYTTESTPIEQQDTGDATATLSGTPTEGQVLTATFNDDDPDGAATGITYQWFRDPSGTNTSIGGATANTYTLVNADVGFVVRCRVQYTDANGTSETIYTANSAAIAAIDSGDATATLGGSTTVGQNATCTFNDNDPDGAASGVAYQWFRDPAGTNTSIGGATNSTYTLQAADEGFTVRCRVTYTDAQGFSETIYTATSAVVAAGSSNFSVTLQDQSSTNSAQTLNLGPGAIPADRIVIVAVTMTHASFSPSVNSVSIPGGGTMTKIDEVFQTWSQATTRRGSVTWFAVHSGAGIAAGTWTITGAFTNNFIGATMFVIAGSERTVIAKDNVNPAGVFHGDHNTQAINQVGTTTISYTRGALTSSNPLLIAAAVAPGIQTGIANLSAAATNWTAQGDQAQTNGQMVTETWLPGASGNRTVAFQGATREALSSCIALNSDPP